MENCSFFFFFTIALAVFHFHFRWSFARGKNEKKNRATITTFSWAVLFYKITKIVRALEWPRGEFRWEYVNMVVTWARANHPSTNLKKILSWKLDKYTLFTHLICGWNLENRFKREKSRLILERLSVFFAKQEDYTYKLRVQHFATGKDFSFN